MNVQLPNEKQVSVFISHLRDPNDIEDETKSGLTIATVKVDGVEYHGKAACVVGDNFNRHKGIQIALARALKKSGVGEATRKAVWAKVFNNKYGG